MGGITINAVNRVDYEIDERETSLIVDASSIGKTTKYLWDYLYQGFSRKTLLLNEAKVGVVQAF